MVPVCAIVEALAYARRGVLVPACIRIGRPRSRTPKSGLLASVLQPLAAGAFFRAASLYAWRIDLNAYKYFARVVLLLWIIAQAQTGTAAAETTLLQHLA